MLPHSRHRQTLIAPLVGAVLAALCVGIGSSPASRLAVRELPTSTPQNPTYAALRPGTTYRASIVSPTPMITPAVRGWLGAQFVSHKHNAVRYETGWLSWQKGRPCGPAACSGQEVDIVAGPAMTETPAALFARVRNKDWNFDPYDPPGPVRTWSLAGRSAIYFDATVPPGSPEWALVGVNPPELKVARDHSFRMSALTVRGKTVVIVIQGPAADFAQFLPIAKRLVASLRFPPS
jgi:hypothetical protein